MELSQLKTLMHVAELGSVSKAADRLNIVQPALSRQIRLLEEELGVSLFDRHGRGMSVTPIGQEILDHTVRILGEVEALRATASEGQSSFRGLVRIGTTPTVADVLGVPLIAEVARAHPKLQLRYSTAFSGFLMDWLKRGELDLVVSYDPPQSPSVVVQPVLIEALHLVCHPEHRLAPEKSVPFSALAEMKFVLPGGNHGLRTILDECARKSGVGIATLVETDSMRVMVDMTRAGLAVTVLPLAPIHEKVARGDLVAIPITDPVPERKVVICTSADRPTSPATRYVAETIQEISHDLVATSVWGGRRVER